VITLAMGGVAQGLTLGLSQGLTCSSCASYAPPVIRHAVTGEALGIPGGLFLWLGIALLMTFVLGYTTFGRRVYAIGNNSEASFLAGVNVRLVTVVLGRGNYLGSTAGSITLVALVTLLLAENMPDWGRDVVYGGVILVILLLYGREKTAV
jgi:ribose transport system permease protein